MRAVEVSTKKLSWAFLGLVRPMLQAQYVGFPRHIDSHGDPATECQSGDLQRCSQEPPALLATAKLGGSDSLIERLETAGG